ncbi:ArsC family reductase [Aristophania vespae]|uniref:ArsC family reductase n=1 Tax=Aristophania vespae TaxID=2697033 RepID=UPI002351A94E|nr:ArsC family reductase [Aristophania vespae]UMM64330.1 Protein YffB [Aristophania vespae]
MTLPVHIYGIKNCSTVKKALTWLTEHNISHVFHDFKKEGANKEKLAEWIKQVGWEALLNKRGTTFRKLSDEEKENLTQEKALYLMTEHPTLIKRPVIENSGVILGFSENVYTENFL